MAPHLGGGKRAWVTARWDWLRQEWQIIEREPRDGKGGWHTFAVPSEHISWWREFPPLPPDVEMIDV
jgi:hypothetical protein